MGNFITKIVSEGRKNSSYLVQPVRSTSQDKYDTLRIFLQHSRRVTFKTLLQKNTFVIEHKKFQNIDARNLEH